MDRREFFKRMGLIVAGSVALDLDAKANTMMSLSEGEIPEIAASSKIATKIPDMDAKLEKVTQYSAGAFLLLTACGIRHYEADSRSSKKDKELAGEIESGTILNGSEPEKVSDTDSLEEAFSSAAC